MLSLDPRSKLIATVTATILLMAIHRWVFLGLVVAVLVMAIFLFRLVRPWLNLLKGLGFAVVSFFIIASVAFDLVTGIAAGFRLLAMGTVFFLFFQSTSPESLSNALVKMGIPYPFAFLLTASMQFIPVLVRRVANIRDAQRARGIPLEKGLGIVRHLPALAGPLLIQAFKLADELAEAMEARGFGAPGRRFRHEPHFRWIDWLVLAVSAFGLATFFWIRH